jgi:conjugal transfer/entry exclusion protein
MKILSKRQEVMMAIKWLRDKIASYFTGISDSAISQWVKATVKQLTAMLKSIQKFLKFINNVVLEIAKLTAQIRQLITWILSLPVRLLVLLQDCLTHFFNSISDAFSESLSVGGDSTSLGFSEVTELVNQAQSTFGTAMETVEATTIVYTEIKAIESTFEKV